MRYNLKDLLDCPVNSCFIVCVAANGANLEHGNYIAEKDLTIADKLKQTELEIETWRMAGQKYIVVRGKLDQSNHYSDVKMKSVSRRQFVDVFENESGDFSMRFNSITSCLTIPWCDVLHASRTIMIFGV